MSFSLLLSAKVVFLWFDQCIFATFIFHVADLYVLCFHLIVRNCNGSLLLFSVCSNFHTIQMDAGLPEHDILRYRLSRIYRSYSWFLFSMHRRYSIRSLHFQLRPYHVPLSLYDKPVLSIIIRNMPHFQIVSSLESFAIRFETLHIVFHLSYTGIDMETGTL